MEPFDEEISPIVEENTKNTIVEDPETGKKHIVMNKKNTKKMLVLALVITLFILGIQAYLLFKDIPSVLVDKGESEYLLFYILAGLAVGMPYFLMIYIGVFAFLVAMMCAYYELFHKEQ